jgi:hypothetical protein
MAMFQPVLQLDAKEVLAYFAFAGSRAPLGISIALNRTAELATARTRTRVRRVMDVRSEQALRFALPVVLPGKLRANPSNLRAIIEPERIGQIYGPFEQGEIHGADSLGRMPAIPSTGFMGLRKTEKTVIPRALYPVNLGLQPRRDASSTKIYYALGGRRSKRFSQSPARLTSGGKVQLQGKRRTFQLPGAMGPVIWQRFGPGPRDIRALWFLRPSVPRPALLQLYETVQNTIDDEWTNEAQAALGYVMGLGR